MGFSELLALARDPGKAQRRTTARNPLACAACLKAGWNGFFELLALARDPGRLKGELQPETLWHARHALRRAGMVFRVTRFSS